MKNITHSLQTLLPILHILLTGALKYKILICIKQTTVKQVGNTGI